MTVHYSMESVFENQIGKGGITSSSFEKASSLVSDAVTRLRQDETSGRLPLLRLPREFGDLLGVAETASSLRAETTDLVILGTGGSSLGGQTLAQLKDYGIPCLSTFREAPRIHFLDNLDPVTFSLFLQKLPLDTSRFLVISKSGGTGETLIQTITVLAAYKEAGQEASISNHIFGLSEPRKNSQKNALRDLLSPFGVHFLDHHTGVGGRYSVLTNVGLLPAATLGLDVAAIRQGAAQAYAPILDNSSFQDIPSAQGAALNVAAVLEGKNIAVLMAYGDRFERLTRWWVQLWAESLGKDGKGTQPVAAIGPVDQHSQQQLYLGGPRDKLFTILTMDFKGKGSSLNPELSHQAHEDAFSGHTIGDFVSAQGKAAADTFAKNGCPTRRIHIETLNEISMGELLMHFMLETILAGYAIGVDPFDQPAVEEAKILAKQYLAEK